MCPAGQGFYTGNASAFKIDLGLIVQLNLIFFDSLAQHGFKAKAMACFFIHLMGKKLGGEEQVQAFLVEWGATFKSGDNWTVSLMPEASDYGN